MRSQRQTIDTLFGEAAAQHRHGTDVGDCTDPAPVQMTRGAAMGGLLGGGVAGASLALASLGFGALSLANPLALAAIVAVPAVMAAVAAHVATGPDVPKIPNLMHFIWLGGALPKERLNNILAWKNSAKGVAVHLWLDENSARAMDGDIRNLQSQGIVIRQISSLAKDGTPFDSLRKSLPTVREEGATGSGKTAVHGPSAAAVSDVARLEILSKEGGHYMDSDNHPGKRASEFKDMPAPSGFRLGWGKIGDSAQSLDEGFSNDAMSAVPNSDFINRYKETAYNKLRGNFAGSKGSKPAISAISQPADAYEKKESVMSTTGPNAMKEIPLRIGGTLGEKAAKELESKGGDQKEGVDLGISDFKTMRELITNNAEQRKNFSPDRFPPAMRALFESIGYSSEFFTRYSGGSWHGENEGKQ